MKQAHRVILASRSPQRSAILTQLGVSFDVRPANVVERERGHPDEVVRQNALAKARAVADPARTVIGVDTVVAIDGTLYGKPADEGQARATLDALSGRTHQVWSAIALIEGRRERVDATSTDVLFRQLDEQTLDWYVATGEWRERAGAYAIQGRGAALVERIEGDYWNVVGLPVPLLIAMQPGLITASSLQNP
jgi:septum formation protein